MWTQLNVIIGQDWLFWERTSIRVPLILGRVKLCWKGPSVKPAFSPYFYHHRCKLSYCFMSNKRTIKFDSRAAIWELAFEGKVILSYQNIIKWNQLRG